MLFARLLILRIRRLLSDYVVSMRHSVISSSSSSSSFGRAAFDFERKESKASCTPKPIIQTRTPTMSLAHIYKCNQGRGFTHVRAPTQLQSCSFQQSQQQKEIDTIDRRCLKVTILRRVFSTFIGCRKRNIEYILRIEDPFVFFFFFIIQCDDRDVATK